MTHRFLLPVAIAATLVSFGVRPVAAQRACSCYVARVRPGSDAAAQGLARGDLVLSVNGHLATRANLWQLE